MWPKLPNVVDTKEFQDLLDKAYIKQKELYNNEKNLRDMTILMVCNFLDIHTGNVEKTKKEFEIPDTTSIEIIDNIYLNWVKAIEQSEEGRWQGLKGYWRKIESNKK